MPRVRTRAPSLVLAVSSAAWACGRSDEPPTDAVAAEVVEQVDEPFLARTPSLHDLEGREVDPLSDSDARAVVLVFVSTHCPVANRYAPTIARLAEDWRLRGVATWLVYPDPDDEPAAIGEHQAEYSLGLPTVRDPEHRLVARSKVRVTPEAAVFVPGTKTPAYRGRIDDRVVELGKVRAEATTHELADAVTAVLFGEAPAPAGGPAIGCYISDLR